MAGTIVFVELFNLEDVGTGDASSLLDLRSVNLDPIAGLEITSSSFEGVGLGVAGLKLESVRAGNNAAAHNMVAMVDGENHSESYDRTDADRSACNRGTAGTNMATLLCCESDGQSRDSSGRRQPRGNFHENLHFH